VCRSMCSDRTHAGRDRRHDPTMACKTHRAPHRRRIAGMKPQAMLALVTESSRPRHRPCATRR
jgi:hypothetical protein